MTDLEAAEDRLSEVTKAAWLKPASKGVVVATFAGFDAEGRFLVLLDDQGRLLSALSTIGLTPDQEGAAVIVAFEDEDRERPVILGLVQPPQTASAVAVRSDGERLVLKAEREIELRCGDASIVLTRAGKVLICGSYVLSRSRGANKIKGAFVDIN